MTIYSKGPIQSLHPQFSFPHKHILEPLPHLIQSPYSAFTRDIPYHSLTTSLYIHHTLCISTRYPLSFSHYLPIHSPHPLHQQQISLNILSLPPYTFTTPSTFTRDIPYHSLTTSLYIHHTLYISKRYPLSFSHYIVAPYSVYSGTPKMWTPWGPRKSVLIREMSLLHWDKTECPDQTRCPDFRVSTFSCPDSKRNGWQSIPTALVKLCKL